MSPYYIGNGPEFYHMLYSVPWRHEQYVLRKFIERWLVMKRKIVMCNKNGFQAVRRMDSASIYSVKPSVRVSISTDHKGNQNKSPAVTPQLTAFLSFQLHNQTSKRPIMIGVPQQELSGVLVALITPFKDDGKSVDEVLFQKHVDHIIESGCHGLVPGGSTGEFTAMTLEERKRVNELSIKFAAGRVPVVAGIGALSTKDCVELAEHAGKVGAAAVMVVPPFYDPVNYEQVQELMSEISTAANLPIVYYHIPTASGLNLTPKEIAGLSKVGVKYLKDTSGNAPAFTELVFAYPDQITAFNGWDTLTFSAMAAGTKGAVWGASNIIPELSAELWQAVGEQGDLKKGRELWTKIFPLCKFLESHNYSSAVKTAMELTGRPTGGSRKPFSLLTGEPRKELAQILRKMDMNVIE